MAGTITIAKLQEYEAYLLDRIEYWNQEVCDTDFHTSHDYEAMARKDAFESALYMLRLKFAEELAEEL